MSHGRERHNSVVPCHGGVSETNLLRHLFLMTWSFEHLSVIQVFQERERDWLIHLID